MDLEVLQKLNEKRIFAVCIVSHTSHVFNIGDRTVFGNMKKYWMEELRNYLRKKRRFKFIGFSFYTIKQEILECLFGYFPNVL